MMYFGVLKSLISKYQYLFLETSLFNLSISLCLHIPVTLQFANNDSHLSVFERWDNWALGNLISIF